MKDGYDISEFHLMLKLGLFRSGKVGNWGYISVCDNPLYLKRPLAEYQRQLYAEKQLGIGLYLHDLYLLQKDNIEGTYIMVISVCRTNLNCKEKIYVLKLLSNIPTADIKTAIMNGTLFKKRSSIIQRQSNRRSIDTSPINSIPRKH